MDNMNNTTLAPNTLMPVIHWEAESLAGALARFGKKANPWLVEQLVHRSVTVIASPPKAGKSAFAVGLIAALSSAAPEFLGQPVLCKGESVIFHTDANSREEYTKRLDAHGVDGERVHFVEGRDLTLGPYHEWLARVDHFCTIRPDLRLVVVDNVLGVLGDVSPGERLNQFYSRLQDFNKYDVSVLILHHTAVQDETGFGFGKRPQGGRSNETSARQILMLLPHGKSAPSNVLRLEATGNDLAGGKTQQFVELLDRDDSPTVVISDWRASSERTSKRTEERLDKGERIRELANFIMENHKPTPTSRDALAKLIHAKHRGPDDLNLSWYTIRDKLRQMGYVVAKPK
jgi:hypothetical protein